jgi:hypothetical protein
LGVHPVFKRVDTCAAEFEARTPYLYGCYETGIGTDLAAECEAWPSERRKVMILGGGPNRIGQGIEFDYCCVHAAFALAEAGFETIMVNCNPETDLEYDYDTRKTKSIRGGFFDGATTDIMNYTLTDLGPLEYDLHPNDQRRMQAAWFVGP